MVTPDSPQPRQDQLNQESAEKIKSQLLAVATEFIGQFSENHEQWFGEPGNYFYLKVEYRSPLNEVSIKLANLKEQAVPASSAGHPLGDYDNPSIIYKLNLTLRNEAPSYLELTGEPLPQTMFGYVRFYAKREAMRIGLISASGKVNTKIITFPLRDGSMDKFIEIGPKAMEIIQFFSELVENKR